MDISGGDGVSIASSVQSRQEAHRGEQRAVYPRLHAGSDA
jgi:hypothetical protein